MIVKDDDAFWDDVERILDDVQKEEPDLFKRDFIDSPQSMNKKLNHLASAMGLSPDDGVNKFLKL